MKHSSTPPPRAMSTYRPRLVEVQALDCGDGRHVLLGETPRYMPSAEFLEAFELVESKRNGGRPKNGRVKRAKGAKRSTGARRARASATEGEDPKKPEAQRMFEKEGKRVSEISKVLKLPYSRVYAWSQGWKPPAKTAKVEKGEEPWME